MSAPAALPEFVVIEFSAICNLKCGFCFGPTDDRLSKDLPTAFWLDAIDWLAAAGVRGISVSGGEPTLHRDIVALLSRIRDNGLGLVMSTHGQFRRRLLECAPLLDWVALPVDGASDAMLIEMRGKAWGVQDAKRLIADLRSVNPKLKVKLGTVANKVNQNEVARIGRALVDGRVPVDTWKIYQYTARRQFKDRRDIYELSDASYLSVCEKADLATKGRTFEIVHSSNEARQAAYLFVYPDGSLVLPNQGIEMEDLVVGNLFREGRDVLMRVPPTFSAQNHSDNYQLTYPGAIL